jgi:arsenate reductase
LKRVISVINIKVLFLCTGNSARSQMAEGWLRQLADEQVTALSAGLNPKGVNPLAIEVMRDVGMDISRQVSKHAAEFLGQPIQYVVTVCDNAHERCPVFPLAYKYLHWSVPDPAVPPMLPHRWRRFATHAICSRSASQRSCFRC